MLPRNLARGRPSSRSISIWSHRCTATGTFLNGLIHVGEKRFSAGRSGELSSVKLAENLRHLGFRIGRLKTGTPPRLDSRTIDFNQFEEQPGDKKPTPFSFTTKSIE